MLATAAAALALAIGARATPVSPAADGPGDRVVLQRIIDVRSLAPEQAENALAVRITGVVTRCTRYELYLQDDTTAIFVTPRLTRPLYEPGDVVEITGKTAPGEFLPIVLEETSRLVGHAELPPPHAARYGELASGRLDCFWVDVSGVIRSVQLNASHTLSAQLAMDGAVLQVELTDAAHLLPQQLIGAAVRVRGVAGGLKNRQRQLVQPMVWVTATEQTVRITQAPPNDLFAAPSQPIATLLSSHDTGRPSSLSKVVGQVIWAESSRVVYVRDATGTVETRLQADADVRTGDLVAVVGFAENGTTKPVLVDSFVRRLAHGPSPRPRATTVTSLLQRNDAAELVEIEALLVGVAQTSHAVTLTLFADGVRFEATYLRQPGDSDVRLPELGSRLVVVGVSRLEQRTWSLHLVVNAVGVSICLRSLDDIRVVTAPSWWTVPRLMYAVGALTAGLLLAAAWIGSLRRTVARQTQVIVAKTRAEATAEERDRIAREFHDSLEQRLAGATMVLDAAASVLPLRADVAKDHVDTARAMLRDGLEDAQRAVLNLRSRELEIGDFTAALERSLRSLVALQPVTLVFTAVGNARGLDAVAEDHVLRVAQEAVTNALKHGNPTTLRITLTFEEEMITLRVEDDGRGFGAEHGGSEGRGHFGLIGMCERAEKLHGSVDVDSRSGVGTVVTLTFPHAPADRRSSFAPTFSDDYTSHHDRGRPRPGPNRAQDLA